MHGERVLDFRRDGQTAARCGCASPLSCRGSASWAALDAVRAVCVLVIPADGSWLLFSSLDRIQAVLGHSLPDPVLEPHSAPHGPGGGQPAGGPRPSASSSEHLARKKETFRCASLSPETYHLLRPRAHPHRCTATVHTQAHASSHTRPHIPQEQRLCYVLLYFLPSHKVALNRAFSE